MAEKRTQLQNRAGHLWFTHFADTLNEAGLDQRKVLKETVNIPWTSTAFKEQVFKPIMKAMYGYTSTTELSTAEFTKVCEVIEREMGEKHGIQVDFPSEESLQAKMRGWTK